jgi:hypothetical protein
MLVTAQLASTLRRLMLCSDGWVPSGALAIWHVDYFDISRI